MNDCVLQNLFGGHDSDIPVGEGTIAVELKTSGDGSDEKSDNASSKKDKERKNRSKQRDAVDNNGDNEEGKERWQGDSDDDNGSAFSDSNSDHENSSKRAIQVQKQNYKDHENIVNIKVVSINSLP